MIGNSWLLITVLLLLASLILRQTPLLLICILFFLTSGAARLWAKHMLDKVDYRRNLSATKVSFGDEITIDITIANRKILPLPWVQINEEVPDELAYPKGRKPILQKQSRAILPNVLSLSWYHQLTRRHVIKCVKRGYFSFGPTTITSGDLFGFFRKQTTETKVDNLLVYPKTVPLEELGISSNAIFGNHRIRRHLFEDPIRVVTTREYYPGDPLKRIHWKATARSGHLQTRVFEPTTTPDLALFLDVCTIEPPIQGLVPHLLETAIMATASIAQHTINSGYRIGLYVNNRYRTTGQMIKLPPSAQKPQLQRILEALAHIQGLSFSPMDQLVNNEARNLSWGTTVVVVTAIPNNSILAILSRLQRAGRRVSLITIGEVPTSEMNTGFPVYHVSDNIYWRDLEALTINQTRTGTQL